MPAVTRFAPRRLTSRLAGGSLALLALAASTTAGAAAAGAGAGATEVTGEVQRIVVELLDGSAVHVTAVVPEDGASVAVDPDALAAVETGSVVKALVGPVTDANQEVTSAGAGADVLEVDTVLAAAPAIEAAPAFGAGVYARAVPVLTALLPGQTSDLDGVTPAMLAADMTDEVQPYWSDSTDGAVQLSAGTEIAAGSYPGWGDAATCTNDQVLAFLDWTAQVAGVYPTAGQMRHTVAYTPRMAACRFAGAAHVSLGGSAWINGKDGLSSRADIIAHELGHTLALGHSDSRFDCVTGTDGAAADCKLGAYGSAYDTMGFYNGENGPLSGAQLDVIGLLTPTSAVVATSSRDVTLAPVGGLAGVRFLTFSTGGATYYVEYRGAVGRDADLATVREGCPTGAPSCVWTRYVPGVVVHRSDDPRPGMSPTLLRAGGTGFVLPAGQSFTTADGVYRLQVTSTSTSGAQVSLLNLTEPPPPEPAAPAGAAYVPVAPTRVMSRVPMGPASTTTLTIPGVPAGATAVALNVTATAVGSTSYISACATGTPLDTCRATSALNPTPGADTASAVLVALGGPARDQVTLYNNAGTLALIADLQGFYVDGPTGGATFVSQSPARAMDRRFGPAEPFTLTLRDVPAGATAVALNITSSAASRISYISACPQGQALSTCTRSSTLNPLPGRDLANFSVVKLGGAYGTQVTLYNNAGDGRIIADVAGYFVDASQAPAGTGRYEAIAPVRALDREPFAAGTVRTLTLADVPVGATAVAMNLTAAGTTGTSYVSACPGGTPVTTCRTTSVFNPARGVDTSNNVMVKLGGPSGNQVLLYNDRSTIALIADVQGYFISSAAA